MYNAYFVVTVDYLSESHIMNERERVQKIMECEGLNSKQFSQEIGVSAGTISNILGGRNKPSLEVMQAILRRFRNINPLWIIDGEGVMYPTSSSNDAPRLPFPDEIETKTPKVETKVLSPLLETSPISAAPAPTPPRTVQKVMIFYSDGTFEER